MISIASRSLSLQVSSRYPSNTDALLEEAQDSQDISEELIPLAERSLEIVLTRKWI